MSLEYSGIGGAAGAGVFSGISVMSVSVVRIIVAIDAAFSSAERVTLSGSMMPALEHVPVLALGGVVALALALAS